MGDDEGMDNTSTTASISFTHDLGIRGMNRLTFYSERKRNWGWRYSFQEIQKEAGKQLALPPPEEEKLVFSMWTL